jgi:biotin synthase
MDYVSSLLLPSMDLSTILNQGELSFDDLVFLLKLDGKDRDELLKHSARIKRQTVGNKVYIRGLIEFSNFCSKDCLYCSIRKSNEKIVRYNASDEEILDSCRCAWENHFGSVVLQSGELSSPAFVKRVARLLKDIKELSDSGLGITLSCGEQTKETYALWRESGAERYLLRIETSNPDLFYKIHPNNEHHRFEKRLEALQFLGETGYQVGTGTMIGMPFQTYEDLAYDLLFFKDINIDMCRIGTYIGHENTPLFQYQTLLKPIQQRFDLTMNMIACLRLLMPDINIAAAASLQAVDQKGTEKALEIGANLIMPDLTPCIYRREYQLYQGKPCRVEDARLCINCIETPVGIEGVEIGYNETGDSKHFIKRVGWSRHH